MDKQDTHQVVVAAIESLSTLATGPSDNAVEYAQGKMKKAAKASSS